MKKENTTIWRGGGLYLVKDKKEVYLSITDGVGFVDSLDRKELESLYNELKKIFEN